MDECQATPDGPDTFARVRLTEDSVHSTHFRHLQGGGKVMFCAAINGDTIVGPFFVKID